MSGRTNKLIRRAMGMGRNGETRRPHRLNRMKRSFLRMLKKEYKVLPAKDKREAREWMRGQA